MKSTCPEYDDLFYQEVAKVRQKLAALPEPSENFTVELVSVGDAAELPGETVADSLADLQDGLARLAARVNRLQSIADVLLATHKRKL